MTNSTVSVIGLGKLGACIAALNAKKRRVIGVDVQQHVVTAVNNGKAPVDEPGLSDAMNAVRASLSATTSIEQAVIASDISFIVVPTPSDDAGAFSLHYVNKVARSIGETLHKKSDYHLVVLTSTVLPGACDFSIKPILERYSGKICGRDFGFCYNPEFIALGTVLRDLANPDMVLIGESDKKSGALLESFYKDFCDNNPTIVRTNITNAELAKVSLNSYVTTKITFANMLADICEQVPGGNIDEVTRVLGLDSRIGPKYLRGGLGYGGPCFPRDNVALSTFAKLVGKRTELSETTDEINRDCTNRIVSKLEYFLRKGMNAAVLGLSYKPGSSVTEESQGLNLASEIKNRGIKVTVYDPLSAAMDNARMQLGAGVNYAGSSKEAVAAANLVIIANADAQFSSLRPEDFKVNPVLVFDCWRLLASTLSSKENIEYRCLGIAPSEPRLSKRLSALWNP